MASICIQFPPADLGTDHWAGQLFCILHLKPLPFWGVPSQVFIKTPVFALLAPVCLLVIFLGMSQHTWQPWLG